MKVRVSYTVDVSDDYRRAVNQQYGREGLATRDQVRRWLEAHGASQDQDLMQALQDIRSAGHVGPQALSREGYMADLALRKLGRP